MIFYGKNGGKSNDLFDVAILETGIKLKTPLSGSLKFKCKNSLTKSNNTEMTAHSMDKRLYIW